MSQKRLEILVNLDGDDRKKYPSITDTQYCVNYLEHIINWMKSNPENEPFMFFVPGKDCACSARVIKPKRRK